MSCKTKLVLAIAVVGLGVVARITMPTTNREDTRTANQSIGQAISQGVPEVTIHGIPDSEATRVNEKTTNEASRIAHGES